MGTQAKDGKMLAAGSKMGRNPQNILFAAQGEIIITCFGLPFVFVQPLAIDVN